MENKYSLKVLFCFIFVSFSILVQIAESSNSTEITGFDSDGYVKTSNCSLVPERERKRLKLDQLIDENNRLIKLSITVKWNQYQPNETYPTDMLWFLVTDTTGQHLLLLDDNYNIMSLGTLSYGVAAMQLTLTQNPENCLQDLTPDEADKVLKYSVLTLPDTSKAVNEEGISILRICNGTLNAKDKSSCCKLTLTGTQVQCFFLLVYDTPMFYVICITYAVVIIAIMRINYLMPKFFYEDNKDNSYTLQNKSGDQTFCIKLGMTTKHNMIGEWTKIRSQDIRDEPLQQFSQTIRRHPNVFECPRIQSCVYIFNVKLNSVKMDEDQLVSECRSSPRLSHSLYKTFSDVFLKCKMRNADFLRPIFCKPFYGKMRRSVFFNKITKLLIIFICLLPLICRIIFILFISNYHNNLPYALTYLIVCIVLVVVSVLVLFVEVGYHKKRAFNVAKTNIVTVLQKLHKYDTKEKLEKFIYIILSPFRFKYYIVGIILLPFSFLYGMFSLIYYFVPIVHFPRIIFGREKRGERAILTILYPILCTTTLLLIDCVFFYVCCFSYILVGLLLNFDHVSKTILLILIVLTYAFDCLSRAYNQINHFNNRVMKVLRELIDTCSAHDKEKLYQNEHMEKCVSKQHPNQNQNAWQDEESDEDDMPHRCIRGYGVVGERQEDEVEIENKIELLSLNMLSQTGDHFITIQADGEGTPCLSTTGLLIYYKPKRPENLPFVHVSERFFDELASKYGQLSPGPKYMILFGACKEIASLLAALSVVFLVISGFGGINDLSAGIEVFVTIGSSTVLVMLNKLLFKADEYSLNDNDSHLKALVKRHAKRFRDFWSETSLEIVDFAIDTSSVRGFYSHLPEDCDIVVEICPEKKPEVSESWYVRPFFFKIKDFQK